MELKNKRFLVVGMALSGIEAAKHLAGHGARVTLYDHKRAEDLEESLKAIETYPIDVRTGSNPEETELFDYMVLSPGVPTDLPFVRKARERGRPEVMGELELAYRLCKGKFIAITGTNGKTTTTALTGDMFKRAGLETHVVGNIGVPAISVADRTGSDSCLITEVSSFQLETIHRFRPETCAILNVTPDHLNRHGTLKAYIQAKKRIFENMRGGRVVLNLDNPVTRKIAEDLGADGPKPLCFSASEVLEEGVFVKNGRIVVAESGQPAEGICLAEEVFIPGRHNLENALAAVALGHVHGIAPEVMRESLKRFEGVEHRIEYVMTLRGVAYYNDSKGTNPDASIKAVEAFDGPVVLIAGGMDKGSDFGAFIDAFKGKVKEMIVLGETAPKLVETAGKKGFHRVTRVEDMEEAVARASRAASDGDVVLLSPACASWDMYKSYEYRGRHFKTCVRALGG